MNTKEAIQNAVLKYKKSKRNAWVTFIVFLIYAVVGWKLMMVLYGSFMTMLLMVFFVIPFIPAALYILIGYGLLALVWSFVEDADQAKRDIELFSPNVKLKLASHKKFSRRLVAQAFFRIVVNPIFDKSDFFRSRFLSPFG